MSAPGTPLAILTRPAGRNEDIARRLRAEGLAVMVAPALALRPLQGPAPTPDDYDLLVFVSRQAVESYFDHWRGQWPASTLAAAVGQATARALREHIPSHQVLAPPADSAQDSEALLTLIDTRGLRPARALILRGERGREWLADQLRRRACLVERHALYSRYPVPWSHAQCQMAIAGHPSVLLLSSLEGLEAISENFRRHGLNWPRALCAVVIHERIARRLQCLVEAGSQASDPQSMLSVKICAPDDQAIFQAILAASRLRC